MPSKQTRQFRITGEFTFRGEALIDATDIDDAQKKLHLGEFEFQDRTASMTGWPDDPADVRSAE